MNNSWNSQNLSAFAPIWPKRNHSDVTGNTGIWPKPTSPPSACGCEPNQQAPAYPFEELPVSPFENIPNFNAPSNNLPEPSQMGWPSPFGTPLNSFPQTAGVPNTGYPSSNGLPFWVPMPPVSAPPSAPSAPNNPLFSLPPPPPNQKAFSAMAPTSPIPATPQPAVTPNPAMAPMGSYAPPVMSPAPSGGMGSSSGGGSVFNQVPNPTPVSAPPSVINTPIISGGSIGTNPGMYTPGYNPNPQQPSSAGLGYTPGYNPNPQPNPPLFTTSSGVPYPSNT